MLGGSGLAELHLQRASRRVVAAVRPGRGGRVARPRSARPLVQRAPLGRRRAGADRRHRRARRRRGDTSGPSRRQPGDRSRSRPRPGGSRRRRTPTGCWWSPTRPVCRPPRRILEELRAGRRIRDPGGARPRQCAADRVRRRAGRLLGVPSRCRTGSGSPLAAATREFALPAGQGYVWMAGEASCSRDIRRYVRHELGWKPARYDIVGYWRPRPSATSGAIGPSRARSVRSGTGVRPAARTPRRSPTRSMR